jgi:membrane peptidoglycan carboxypeptidase
MTLLQKIKSQIDALPEKQRFKVVDYVLHQEGDISEAEAEKAWAKEIKKRYDLHLKGKGRTYSLEQMLKRVRRKLA